MKKIIALLVLLASLGSAAAIACDSSNDGPVDCFYDANAYNPACGK